MTLPNESPFKSKSGLQRIVKAAQYSTQGLKAAFKHEAAFRQELLLCAIMMPLAFYLGRNLLEILFLLATLVCVLVVELLNSALEALADQISLEHHPLLGRAKDLGSAAVMLTLIFTTIVWIAIAIDPYI